MCACNNQPHSILEREQFPYYTTLKKNTTMIKKTILSIILLLVCVFAMAQSQTITHVVQRGETIESIARYYNVSVEDISKANPNMDGVVYVGMKLSIPQSNEPTNAPNSAQPLTVTTVKSQSRPTSIDSKMYSKRTNMYQMTVLGSVGR